MNKSIEFSLAERLLHLATAAARPHAETAEFNSGAAQGDFVNGRAFGGGLSAQHRGWSQDQSTGGKGGAFEELAAAILEIHGDGLPLQAGQTTASRTRFMSDSLNVCGQWSIPQNRMLPQLKLLASLAQLGIQVCVPRKMVYRLD